MSTKVPQNKKIKTAILYICVIYVKRALNQIAQNRESDGRAVKTKKKQQKLRPRSKQFDIFKFGNGTAPFT